FAVRTTSRFERLARTLLSTHPEFLDFQHRAIEILSVDPHNRSRAHHINPSSAATARLSPKRRLIDQPYRVNSWSGIAVF
ncbi:MAG TPA: hypothetical protein VN494_00415, partial [Patescibacteria group bacterium]|nr:hypothetical protein [Patescibacteria group bacterium]